MISYEEAMGAFTLEDAFEDFEGRPDEWFNMGHECVCRWSESEETAV